MSIETEIKTADEIGRMSEAMRKVVDVIRGLLNDVGVVIDKRVKGDIDFFIDAEKYQGDYKTLADDIYRLVNTSDTDTLYGDSQSRFHKSKILRHMAENLTKRHRLEDTKQALCEANPLIFK